MAGEPQPSPRLGLRENLGQFSLLVLVNAFVGSMVGMERSILPALAEEEFDLAATTAVLSFTEALPPGNYFAALFVNDSYTEVSNRVTFTVTP